MKIIPVDISEKCITPDEIKEMSFSQLNLKERHIEDFIRKHIDQITLDEEESLLIIGQQTPDTKGGRSDLIAINSDGDFVLIEIKRDFTDIVHRKEEFEMQAIRYTASLATIKDEEEIIQRLYVRYINQHNDEFEEFEDNLNPEEIARRRLKSFINQHKIRDNINESQLIILVASGFDAYTLSSSAWLAKNGIDIRCVKLEPFYYNEQIHLKVIQEIPPPRIEDYFTEIAEMTKDDSLFGLRKKTITRRSLPRMPKLLEWGIIEEGMELEIVNHPGEKAVVIDAYKVKYKGEVLKFNEWGERITGWSTINIYEWCRPVGGTETLADLRREKMEEFGEEGE